MSLFGEPKVIIKGGVALNKYRRTWIVMVGLLAQCMAATGKEVLSHIGANTQWNEIFTPFLVFSVVATLGVSIVGWLFPSPVEQMQDWHKEAKNGGTKPPNPTTETT